MTDELIQMSNDSAYMIVCCECYEDIFDEDPDIEDFEEFDRCQTQINYMTCAVCKYDSVLNHHLYPNRNFEDTPKAGDLARPEGKRERK